MKNSILSLEGVEVLSKKQQKNIFGGKAIATVCKATCGDDSVITVSACSDASLGCSSSGGAKTDGCTCGHKGPFDPPN
ncbi:MAG: hypothetical protein ACI9FW_001252 [Flavobacterium sp.]|jgi:hypothetical protein